MILGYFTPGGFYLIIDHFTGSITGPPAGPYAAWAPALSSSEIPAGRFAIPLQPENAAAASDSSQTSRNCRNIAYPCRGGKQTARGRSALAR